MARGFRAGPILTAPGGLPGVLLPDEDLNYEVATVVEAQAAVADLVGRDADVLKVYFDPWNDYPMLDEERVRTIVAEAHKRERLVRAHVNLVDVWHLALESGVDVIDHVPKPQLIWNYLFAEAPERSQMVKGSESVEDLRAMFHYVSEKPCWLKWLNKARSWCRPLNGASLVLCLKGIRQRRQFRSSLRPSWRLCDAFTRWAASSSWARTITLAAATLKEGCLCGK